MSELDTRAYLAIDLGAESGRAIVGVLKSGRITLHELHRFAHEPVTLPSGLHWNLTNLWLNVLEGLKRAQRWSHENAQPIASMGVDSWGVDFGLVGASGELYGLPHAYRDPANEAAFEKTIEALGRQRLYELTGIQFLSLNSLYQLVARHAAEPALLHRAHRMLMMSDLMHFLLSGRLVNEVTIASTTQLLSAVSGTWAGGILDALGLPKQFLGPLVPAGTLLGQVRPPVAEIIGLAAPLPIILPAGHDSACAVAAVPADDSTDWCYLSSGTWSVFGAELDEAVLTPAARDADFTNERGIGGTFRFLTNMTGLWLLQECRRDFERHGEALEYAQWVDAARTAEPFRTLIDPRHASFYSPGRMPEKIRAFAATTGQPQPQSPGELARCCLESLAFSYRRTLERLESVLSRRFNVIHVVGGGSKNDLLNQMTADATGRRVVAGPDEATALGNVLIQAWGDGEVEDRFAIRRIVLDSAQPRSFEPSRSADWTHAADRFAQLSG